MAKIKVVARTPQLVSLPSVDAAAFGDPLALEIEWTRVGSRGASGTSRTHMLVQDGVDRVLFRSSPFMTYAGAGVALIGVIIALAPLVRGALDLGSLAVRVLIGLLMVPAGVAMIYLGRTPITFDRGTGLYTRGREAQHPVLKWLTPYEACALQDIHAVQVLVHRTGRGGGGNTAKEYLSYELNLVRKDRSRINVLDHGDADALRADAAELARFLGVPLWDAS